MQREGNSNDQAAVKQLLIKARNADEAAFSSLLEMYEPLILSMVSKYTFEYDAYDDREDILQELRVAFYGAVRGYDTEQNEVDFGFYAKICLRNALVSRLRRKKGRSVEILSIDDVAGLRSPDEPDSYVIELESASKVQKLLDESLSEYEKRVWELYLDGKTPKHIAEQLCKDTKSISNALSRIRMKLRARIKDPNNI